jgi:hypothetical protein
MTHAAAFDALLIQSRRRKEQELTSSELWKELIHLPDRSIKFSLRQAREENRKSDEAVLDHFSK